MNSTISIKPQQYVNLYFQVHQPRRLRKFQFFDIGSGASYFNDDLNRSILCSISKNCYSPANRILLRLIKKYPDLRVTFSISGVVLDALQRYAPSVLDSFRQLASTGAVEFLGETYYHSLSYFINKKEFIAQVEQQREKVVELFGIHPVIFRNTELIYSDAIGQTVSDLGFKGIYLDGIEGVLNGLPVNTLYKHPKADLFLLPRNYRLSDDIAFRYSDKSWSQWPLTPEKFVTWLKHIPASEKFICLAMDYETFGEHQKASGGIFTFFEKMISNLAGQNKFRFVTSLEAISKLSAHDIISIPKAISWADEARDLSAWLGNDMQRDAFHTLNKLHRAIIRSGNEELINRYRHLQTSDHFYYMATKNGNDGNVHQYFSPYSSPYEAFMNYMNILADLESSVRSFQRSYKTKRSFIGTLQPV